MTRSFFFLFFLLQIFSSSYTQNSTNNLFENADMIKDGRLIDNDEKE